MGRPEVEGYIDVPYERVIAVERFLKHTLEIGISDGVERIGDYGLTDAQRRIVSSTYDAYRNRNVDHWTIVLDALYVNEFIDTTTYHRLNDVRCTARRHDDACVFTDASLNSSPVDLLDMFSRLRLRLEDDIFDVLKIVYDALEMDVGSVYIAIDRLKTEMENMKNNIDTRKIEVGYRISDSQVQFLGLNTILVKDDLKRSGATWLSFERVWVMSKDCGMRFMVDHSNRVTFRISDD
jgi:hypothetical protein